jgi:hypothetical protein
MAEMAATLHVVPAVRRKALVIPREHGAWGMLLIPLLCGAAVGFLRGSNFSGFVLLLTASLGLFWLRTPVESLLGSGPMRAQSLAERRLAMKFALVNRPVLGRQEPWTFGNRRGSGRSFWNATAGTINFAQISHGFPDDRGGWVERIRRRRILRCHGTPRCDGGRLVAGELDLRRRPNSLRATQAAPLQS